VKYTSYRLSVVARGRLAGDPSGGHRDIHAPPMLALKWRRVMGLARRHRAPSSLAETSRTYMGWRSAPRSQGPAVRSVELRRTLGRPPSADPVRGKACRSVVVHISSLLAIQLLRHTDRLPSARTCAGGADFLRRSYNGACLLGLDRLGSANVAVGCCRAARVVHPAAETGGSLFRRREEGSARDRRLRSRTEPTQGTQSRAGPQPTPSLAHVRQGQGCQHRRTESQPTQE